VFIRLIRPIRGSIISEIRVISG